MTADRSQRRVFENVVQRIRLEIAKGVINPGDKLPPDRRLVERFGVGRGSMREAIRALELFGLVTVKRGREGGVFFTPNCRELVQASYTKLSAVATLADSLEFRKALEPKAAALAAVRATDEEIAELQRSIALMESNIASSEVFVESNATFHRVIASATRNAYFMEVIPQFLAKPEVVTAVNASETMERTLTQLFHARIAAAIARRDPEMAEEWMHAHLSQIEEDLAEGQKLVQKKLPGEEN